MSDENSTAAKSGNRSALVAPVMVIAVVLVFAALKATAFITLPLALSIIAALLFRPLHVWLGKRLPPGVPIAMIFLLMLLAVAAVIGVAVLAVQSVATDGGQWMERLRSVETDVRQWLEETRIPVTVQDFKNLAPTAFQVVTSGFSTAGTALIGLVLTLVLTLMLLVGFRTWEAKLSGSWSPSARKILDDMSARLQKYVFAYSLASLISGLATFLICLIAGVPLAPLWGLLAFVGNYIPTIGPAVAFVPPALLALIQMPFGPAIGVMAAILVKELIVGNYIDPELQGRSLRVSPFIALLSVLFWGWLWGGLGALIAVPATTILMVGCAYSDNLQPLAHMLSDGNTPQQIRASIDALSSEG